MAVLRLGRDRDQAGLTLIDQRARAYDPRFGRFAQTDPLGYPDVAGLTQPARGGSPGSRTPAASPPLCQSTTATSEHPLVALATFFVFRRKQFPPLHRTRPASRRTDLW